MTPLRWAVEHHVVSVLMDLLVLGFAAAVLRQRRPTGSAFAWLLAVILVPYLGIPLYLIFGGRKYRLKADSKSALPPSAGSGVDDGAAAWGLGAPDSANRVVWLEDGVRAYDAFLSEKMLRARRSIRIATFVLGDDATGRGLVAALARRAREGVEVRLLLDDLLRYKAPRAALAELEAAGGRTARFMPLMHVPLRGRDNLRNHRKIALFDGERAIVGGMNLADEYMGPQARAQRWRDLSVLVGGAAVATLDGIFCADWEFAAREVLTPCARAAPGPVPMSALPSGPDSASDPIYDALLTMIFRTRRRFWVATPYFVPDEPLVRALAVAARRGVDVLVAVPARSNHALADLVGGSYLRELAETGVRVRRLQRMLHAKAVLTDDAVALVGSANFDMRSLFLNYEITLAFTGPAEVAAAQAWFSETIRDAAEGPPVAGTLRSAAESVAQLLAPLL